MFWWCLSTRPASSIVGCHRQKSIEISDYGEHRTTAVRTVERLLLTGDVNGDAVIDIFDIVAVARLIGTSSGTAEYMSTADLNTDGIIEVFELVTVARHFGEHGVH